MAHARRRFVEALKARKKGGGPPEQALKVFEQLYRVEKMARNEIPRDGETRDQCTSRLRQHHSVPILEAFKVWLDDITPKVLPDSKLGDAISYTRNQWEYLARYTEDGRMPIDNNLLERDIRIFATGRKSWLFSDTVAGAKTSAVIYSLMLTCPPVASSRWPGCATSLPNYRNASQRPISLICCPSTSPKRSPQSETARPRPRSAQKRAATCQEMRAYGSSIPSPTNQRNMRLYCICSIGCRSERIEKRMCSRLALISRSGAIEGRPKSA